MLKRFLESKDAIISTLTIINAPVHTLTQEEWEVVREACTVLEPFEQVTVEISAESYVTASKRYSCARVCRRSQPTTTEKQQQQRDK
ncbi:hypothetical protein AAFF_G00383770 [Aldrovandia affinis]|uniref:Uncharacterized protein n=1 Tax=Aldrovandia affinis TaxID=143900 RepID=A0AAD7WLT1_9TELE|nr:hypothetical protein AAFF_G00383770 [Aldrovandia affinis]